MQKLLTLSVIFFKVIIRLAKFVNNYHEFEIHTYALSKVKTRISEAFPNGGQLFVRNWMVWRHNFIHIKIHLVHNIVIILIGHSAVCIEKENTTLTRVRSIPYSKNLISNTFTLWPILLDNRDIQLLILRFKTWFTYISNWFKMWFVVFNWFVNGFL